jgi:hypothetical protein
MTAEVHAGLDLTIGVLLRGVPLGMKHAALVVGVAVPARGAAPGAGVASRGVTPGR